MSDLIIRASHESMKKLNNRQTFGAPNKGDSDIPPNVTAYSNIGFGVEDDGMVELDGIDLQQRVNGTPISHNKSNGGSVEIEFQSNVRPQGSSLAENYDKRDSDMRSKP